MAFHEIRVLLLTITVRAFAPRFLQTSPRDDALCASLTLHLHQSWVEDFHLQAVEHARQTTEKRPGYPGRFLSLCPNHADSARCRWLIQQAGARLSG